MRVKIFVVDSYQANPLPDFECASSLITSKKLAKVPVLRVFGITEGGQKSCVHVHNALPYLLVPCQREDSEYIHNFALSLDAALADGASITFVYDIKVISALPIYGYYASECKFFKIFLLNPSIIKRAADVLLSGKIMGQRFQPHEAHIPYHLQFLINHNLYGMDDMIIKRARFREGSWCTDVESQPEKAAEFVLGQCQRKSCCSCECDINASDIENQFHPFGEASVSSLSALWEDERLRRVNHGMPAEDVKLPVSPEGREIPVNEREKTLLKRFAEMTSNLQHLLDKNIPERGSAAGEDFTQLLEGIVADAAVEFAAGEELSHNNEWGSTPVQCASTMDIFGTSYTQVLEGIVSGAETEKQTAKEKSAGHLGNNIDDEIDEEIEPGSILSFSQHVEDSPSEEEDNEEVPTDDVVEDDLQDVDWNAFIADDDEDISMTPQLPPQMDGTQDKGSKRPTPSREGASLPKRNRRSHQEEGDVPSSSSKRLSGTQRRVNEDSSPVITLSSSSSSSVVVSSVDASGKNFEAGCQLEPTSPSRSPARKVEGDLTDTLAVIAPISPVSDLGTSSIYSFQSSTVWLPLSDESPMMPSVSASPTSDGSVKITGFTPSQNYCQSATPRIMDQTSIQFFQDDLTPFPTTANETDFFSSNKGILKPKRKPPSRGLVDRWLRSSKKNETAVNNTMINAEDIEESYIGPSQKFPALTSTPHPIKLRLETRTPMSTLFMDTTAMSSPIRHTPFSFAVKSMKNVNPIIDDHHRFACQHVTVISMELHAISNSSPDPSRDPIACLVFSKMCCTDVSFNNEIETTVILVKDSLEDASDRHFLPSCTAFGPLSLQVVDDEYILVSLFLDELERVDPEIVCGYETEKSSLGYFAKRASALKIGDVLPRLGRILPMSTTTAPVSTPESRDFSFAAAKGRVFLAVWRLIRHELDHVQSYSFESSAFHVLHRRYPKFHNGLLSWWVRKAATRPRTLLYYIERSLANIQMLIRLNILSQTSELARLYGILFYDCFSRGSQYRVEAVMLRLAKRLNFITVSPSVQQRAAQCAPECIPLTLEPISNYYKSPVIVLDFQSLYPSIMIAYNYSFDTCLGRLERLQKGGPQHLGCFAAGYEVPPGILANLSAESDINISPNGVVFVKRHIRRGVLSAIVEDLLNSRLMVKASLKLYKDEPATSKLLDARQLGLKLLANVTYGYTAANFSGRMPCIEIADAIVRKGRETLENAISLVTTRRNEWGGARVIYGDTDSLFVLIPAATVKEAFDIGAKMADAVTVSNPSPVKLKLEKVFSRCILEAKKRYCGFMYESIDQKEPEFLSKGLETIRKDQCTYVAHVLEKSVRTLFSTDSNEQVIRYLKKEIRRLESGAVSIQDLLLSREYRGARGYSAKGSAAAMILANKRRAVNPLDEPLSGDRVHYVITVDAPGTGIMQTAREPMEIVSNGLRPNVDYYIRRQLFPALDRALGTAEIDVWRIITSGIQTAAPNVVESHRVRMPTYSRVVAASSSKLITLTQMYTRRQCVICGTLTTAQIGSNNQRRGRLVGRNYAHFDKLCATCRNQPAYTCTLLASRSSALERKAEGLSKMCHMCCHFQPHINVADLHFAADEKREIFACSSTDCPIFYEQYNRDSLLSAACECREILNSFESSHVTISLEDDA